VFSEVYHPKAVSVFLIPIPGYSSLQELNYDEEAMADLQRQA
jgi:hypothetical protein